MLGEVAGCFANAVLCFTKPKPKLGVHSRMPRSEMTAPEHLVFSRRDPLMMVAKHMPRCHDPSWWGASVPGHSCQAITAVLVGTKFKKKTPDICTIQFGSACSKFSKLLHQCVCIHVPVKIRTKFSTTPPRQTSPPPTPEPPTRIQSARAAVEVIRTRRRQSAVWAAEWLLGEDGDYLRQPCKVGLLEGVPYDSRPYVISRYCQAVQDLQWATEAYEKEETDANRKVMLGTWTILLRVFPLALCRDRGGGGKTGARKIRAVARVWDEGDYAAAIAHKESARAKRRVGASQPTKKQLFKRVTKYGRQGRLSRMCAAFDAAPVAPGDEDTVKTLKTLSPPTFVPMECPRREAVQTAVRENKKRNRVRLKPEDVAKAVQGMPKSATTWTPVGLMRAVIRTKEGIRRLTWLMDKIVNADVPKEIRPLIFDSKRVALRKDSQHQLSIERLEAAASEDQCHACGTATVGQLEARSDSPKCQRCGRSHASDVSCAPALWAGEHPDEIPTLNWPTNATPHPT
eukprot:SAG31_NODE_354_length_17223_cov_18.708771_19_plen_514_part_00